MNPQRDIMTGQKNRHSNGSMMWKGRGTLLVAMVVGAVGLLAPTVTATPAHADAACESKCERDHANDWVGKDSRIWACKKLCRAADVARRAKNAVVDTAKKGYDWAKDKASKAKDKIVETGRKVVETGRKVVDKVVETGRKVVNKVKNVAKGYWDKAKGCLANGVGGCLKKIAKGAWDATKKCFSDGAYGCLKKIVKKAGELACRGIGVFWDAAKQCCRKQGMVSCLVDEAKKAIGDAICNLNTGFRAACAAWAELRKCIGEVKTAGRKGISLLRSKMSRYESTWARLKGLIPSLIDVAKSTELKNAAKTMLSECKKHAINALKAGGKVLCEEYGPKIGGVVRKYAGLLIDGVAAELSKINQSFTDSELGGLVCNIGREFIGEGATRDTVTGVGNTVNEHIKKLGGLTVNVSEVKLSHEGTNSLTAKLSGKITVTAKGQRGAFTLKLGGQVTVKPGADICEFNSGSNIATVSVALTTFEANETPRWLDSKISRAYVTPAVGSIYTCIPPISVLGAPLELDVCRVVDACLNNSCTAPVVNTVLSKLFPISMPLKIYLPDAPAAEPAIREIKDWTISVGGVKFRTNSRDPYVPSASASISVGSPKGKRIRINAGVGLGITTYCARGQQSMIKVSPSVNIDIKKIPDEIQRSLPQKIASNYWNQIVTEQGGKDGELPITWGRVVSMIKAKMNEPPKPGPKKSTVQKIKDLVKTATPWIKAAFKGQITSKVIGMVRQYLRDLGKKLVSNLSCPPPAPAAKSGGGGGQRPCMKLTEEHKRNKRGPGMFRRKADGTLERLDGSASGGAGGAGEGYISGSNVSFRQKPTRRGPGRKMSSLRRCQSVQILQTGIRGKKYTWTKVKVGSKTGYVASSYVKEGSCGGSSAGARSTSSRTRTRTPTKGRTRTRTRTKSRTRARTPAKSRTRTRTRTKSRTRTRSKTSRLRLPKSRSKTSRLRLPKSRSTTSLLPKRTTSSKAKRLRRPTTRTKSRRTLMPKSRSGARRTLTPRARSKKRAATKRPLVLTPPKARSRSRSNSGYVNGSGVTFRNLPKKYGSKALRYLNRCQSVKILQTGVRGGGITWTKVSYNGQMGYIASKYVKSGSCK